jgi:hypothetical protein
MIQDIVTSRHSRLLAIVQDVFVRSSPHSTALAIRILGPEYVSEIPIHLENECPDATDYGGYPELAGLGFRLGIDHPITPNEKTRFLAGLQRLQSRSNRALDSFSIDDVAVLGLADGLAKLTDEEDPGRKTSEAREWLVAIVDRHSQRRIWTSRLRDLAGDLLDGRGRLRTLPSCDDTSTRALEISLRYVWQEQYSQVPPPSWSDCESLFKELLSIPIDTGDLEKAVAWLKCIDLLFDQSCARLFPRTDRERVAVDMLTAIKARLDQRAERQTRLCMWLFVGFVLIASVVLFILNQQWGWDVTEPQTYFLGIVLGLASLVYFAITGREFSPRAFYERILESRKQHLYKSVNLDRKQYNKIA